MAGSLLLNYYFTPPIHKFTIAEANNALALGCSWRSRSLVSSVVDIAARRTRQAARASAESELLATTAGSVLRGERALEAVLDRVREAFGMDSVTLLECGRSRHGGPRPDDRLARGRALRRAAGRPAGGRRRRRCRSPTRCRWRCAAGRCPPTDRRVLGAFAAYAAVALEQQRLAAEAEAARPIAEADRMRTALLAAVSHDLRTPLASAKAAVTSLRSHGRAVDGRRTGTSCWPPRTSRSTGSPTWWTTCST